MTDPAHARQVAVVLAELPVLQRLAVLLVHIHAAPAKFLPVHVRVQRGQRGRHCLFGVTTGLTVLCAAEGREHGIAGGVDERSGRNVPVALDVLHDDPVDAARVRLGLGVNHAREEAHLHPAFGGHLVQQQLQSFAFEPGPLMIALSPGVRIHMLRHETPLVESFDQLPHEAPDQHLLAVGHGVKRVHEPGGAHTAQAAHRLHQKHIRAEPGRTYSGSAAGRAASRDNQIVLPVHGNLTHQLVSATQRALPQSSECAVTPSGRA